MGKRVIVIFLLLIMLCLSACGRSSNYSNLQSDGNTENVSEPSNTQDRIRKDDAIKTPEIEEPEKVSEDESDEEPTPEFDFGF